MGQHRHSGKQGGHGNAGLHKHKWSWMVINDPDHFGRDPFKPPGRAKPAAWANVGDIDSLSGGEKSVDLASLGIGKLLGSGRVAGAYSVKVASVTKRAQAKIEAAGGKVVLEE